MCAPLSHPGLLSLPLSAGVSCDACLKGNFRGRRFKCLICYDYDLCASCYESGATTTRHTTEHPMQCILTRVDYGKSAAAEPLWKKNKPTKKTSDKAVKSSLSLQTCIMAATRFQLSSLSPSRVLTAGRWASRRRPSRTTSPRSTRRRPRRW